MRLVLDTNIVISGLLWGGPPGRLIDLALAGQIELATSVALLAELDGVLRREKLMTRVPGRGQTVEALCDGYAALAAIVVPAPLPAVVLRDPDDDEVLAAAIAAGADLLVSGDDDLLALQVFRAIPIVSAPAAWERCRAS